ncbi:MAG: DUF2845 domain-containing protein [Desulfobacterium sp.]|nr:DUF2845 domain-containing protein [Desulfobacterium sp.]
MTRKIFIFTLILLGTLEYCSAAPFNCGKHSVAIGDTTYDVLMKCEQPGWMTHNKVEVIEKITHGDWKKVTLNRETWLYNFGPNRFMKELNFINDKLVEIKELGYGYLEKEIGNFGNVENKLYIQMSKPEVLIHWGDPDYTTDIAEERLHRTNTNRYLKYNVTISKWIYNFGPNRFIKTLFFENDRLIKIESGKYGYDK